MTKRWYCGTVDHCIRLYIRNKDLVLDKNTADYRNWVAVKNVYSEANENTKKVIDFIFKQFEEDTRIDERIELYSIINKTKNSIIWKIVNDFETKVAKERGLI